jgi:hypothetical protein
VFVKRKGHAQREARRLRAELGWSLARIARELGVAKSSVSVWVRDLGPVVRSPPDRLARPVDAFPARRLLVWRSGEVRRCGRCGNDLPLECFNRLRDGVQWWCRPCFAAYFRARGDMHRRQSRAAKRARQGRLRAHVLEYLREHPCVECSEADPIVLEFDHVAEKTADISALLTATATIATVDAEMARCEVVCANCHRRRTARRAGWRRADIAVPPRRPYPNALVARNFAHVLGILATNACVDCGEADALLLEFDHVGPKRAPVTRLAWSGASLATIDAEIAQCEIRCANCHRRATASRGGHFRFRAATLGSGS